MKQNILNLQAMKSIITIVTLATVMVACNPNPEANKVQSATTNTAILPDTAGLAQFQAWKAQNELQNMNQQMDQQNNGVAYNEPARTQQRSYAPQRRTTRSTASSSARRSSSGTSSRGTGSSGSTSTARTTQKKGWSKSAKGAVIGGVTGGVAGAVINKRNRVVGGVVGAVIGAGGGYVIGRSQDKKDGRY